MSRSLAIALTFVLSAGACSGGAPTDPTAPANEAIGSPANDDAEESAPAGRSSGGKDKKRSKRTGGDSKATAAEKEGSTGAASTTEDRPARRSLSSTRPPAGTFRFVQEGWEEFCQGGACDRSDLPAGITIEIDHVAKDSFETRSKSGSTDQTISYRSTERRLLIERIVTSSSYRGFEYQSIIAPNPPIVSLELPLSVGATWSGAWSGDGQSGDGSYSGRVLKEVVADQRGREEAFVVQLKLFFKGDVEGFTTVTATVAKRDLMVLSARGKTEAETRFGAYRSEYRSEYRG